MKPGQVQFDFRNSSKVKVHYKIQKEVPHIWILDFKSLHTYQEQFVLVLSEDEVRKAGRFHFEKDRIAYQISRGVLRYLLGGYLQMKPKDIIFHYSTYEKPSLVPNLTELQFNVSHSKDMGLLGFNIGSPIGVDIEFVNYSADLEQVAKRFFSVNEVNGFLRLNEKDRPIGFFNCWTRKESFIKAIGHGLSFPLDQFEVSLAPGEVPELLTTSFDHSEKSKWSLRALDVPQGYCAAFVVPEKISSFKYNYFIVNS